MEFWEGYDSDSEKPSFACPPVVETALGIQFHELADFKSVHFGLFYDTVRVEFPFVEDKPKIPQIIEKFPPKPAIPGLRFEPPGNPQRVWLLDTQEGPHLLQLQPDRFGFNWRTTSEGVAYPSYSEYSVKFLGHFDRFVRFCEAEHLGSVRPDFCEVVYVNRIWPEQSESIIELFGKVFPDVAWHDNLDGWPAPEAVTLNRVYPIGEKRGRLFAEASLGRDNERGDFIVLKMVGRVVCGQGDNSIAVDLKLAHDWVVRGFVEITDPVIRKKRWGQQNG